ncbi:MAG TPA: hypothetical protein VLE89_01600 [Chlamydiales bacterium]|nr:hypothetical protein [Chlamydiales bacterium]
MISFHFIFKDWVNANLLPPDFILSIEPIAVIKAEGNEMDVEQRDVEKSCLIRVRSQRLLYNCPKSASNTYFLTGRRGRDSYFYVNEEIQLKTGEIIKVTMNSNRSYSIRISSSTAV